MSSGIAGVVDRREPSDHPAARAWTALAPHRPRPVQVVVLKAPREQGKSAVYNLGSVGPGGMEVIAKEADAEAAAVERTIYCDVLSELAVGGPRFLGSLPCEGGAKAWLFLEALPGPGFDKRNPRHVELATKWLATLQTETEGSSVAAHLPTRHPGFYESRLDQALRGIARRMTNPALTKDHRLILERLTTQLDDLRSGWLPIAEAYSAIPVVLVHGDFKGNNMGLAVRDGKLEVLVFDWGEAHWGPAAIDLWGMDTATYHRAVRTTSLASPIATIERWKSLSLTLRLISAIEWELPKLDYPWVERPMRNMALYDVRLAKALTCIESKLMGDRNG